MNNRMKPTKSQILEQVCSQGCNVVRKVISDLKSGTTVPGNMKSLNTHQRHEILHELTNIMAVYDKPANK